MSSGQRATTATAPEADAAILCVGRQGQRRECEPDKSLPDLASRIPSPPFRQSQSHQQRSESHEQNILPACSSFREALVGHGSHAPTPCLCVKILIDSDLDAPGNASHGAHPRGRQASAISA